MALSLRATRPPWKFETTAAAHDSAETSFLFSTATPRAAPTGGNLTLHLPHELNGRSLESGGAAHVDRQHAARKLPLVGAPRQSLQPRAEHMGERIGRASHDRRAEQGIEPDLEMIEIDRRDDAVVERDQPRRRRGAVAIVLPRDAE